MDLNSNCFALSMLMTWHFTCVMSETLLSLVASSLPYIVLLEKVPLSREKVEDLLIIILTLTMLTWLLLLLGLSNFKEKTPCIKVRTISKVKGINMFSYPKRIHLQILSFLYWVFSCKELLYYYCLYWGCERLLQVPNWGLQFE